MSSLNWDDILFFESLTEMKILEIPREINLDFRFSFRHRVKRKKTFKIHFALPRSVKKFSKHISPPCKINLDYQFTFPHSV